jgi:C1A family cysteine protease
MCPSNAVRDGHSVLLAGYRDDAAQPGGGVFIFRNTSREGRDGFMPYAYARLYMNDAVWVDFEP